MNPYFINILWIKCNENTYPFEGVTQTFRFGWDEWTFCLRFWTYLFISLLSRWLWVVSLIPFALIFRTLPIFLRYINSIHKLQRLSFSSGFQYSVMNMKKIVNYFVHKLIWPVAGIHYKCLRLSEALLFIDKLGNVLIVYQ